MTATGTSTGVGWDADPSLPVWTGFEPLTDSLVTADACVIGLGGSGLAAVDELASRGLSVVGVDAGRVARGAAGRNGGILACGGAMSFRDACDRFGADIALDLWRRTEAELDWLSERLGPDVIRRDGVLRLAGLPGPSEDDAEAAERVREQADFDADYELMREHGIVVERYDGELGTGLLLPTNGAMNPVARAFGLATQLSGGASLHENTPVLSVSAGSVRTAFGVIRAGVVVVAVDGKLDVLLPQLRPRVRTLRLQMLATSPLSSRRLPCPVSVRWGFDYAQQDQSGRLLVGGGRDRFVEEENTHDDRPTAGVQGRIEHIAARLAGGPVSVTHRWAASVGYTDDHRAVCAEVDDDVVACGAYSGDGNLVGPVAARAAVALAVDGTEPPPYFISDL
jgi:glycine/D-amino acid oxidase-like deaminating enzyme